ncbi:hypothetical protein [Paenibacillus marinisediminis]
MKNTRNIRAVGLILVLFTVLLSGCEWVQDPKSLLSVPKLPEEQANLASIVYSQLPEGATIVQPTNTTESSKIRIADLNNDGRAEAIVFYETPDRSVRLHGMVLESDGSDWSVAAQFDGEGVKLDRVDIVDVTGDNTLDIIIGYGSSDENANKGMVIYTFTNKELIKIFEHPYSYYVIDDLNNDPAYEIYMVNNRKSKPPVLSQFGYRDNTITRTAEKQFDPKISTINNMISGHLNKERRGIILDASIVPNYSVTMAYSMTPTGEFYELFPMDMTTKDWATTSEDINDDGIIEIAIPERPQGWEHYENYEVPYFTNYYQWDGKQGLKLVQRQFRDPLERYHFTIPPSWYGRVSIDTESRIDEYLRFYDIHTNDTLAEVRVFSVETWDRYKDKWTYLAAYADKVIGIYSKEPLKLNDGNTKLPDVEQDKSTDKKTPEVTK